jgi:hypothetical protein
MFIPGFDPKSLTNDGLLDKQLDLTRKRMQAVRFGQSVAAQQLQALIQVIENERTERMFMERAGKYMLASSPVVIETDPVLAAMEKKTEDEAATVPDRSDKPQLRPLRRPMRTAKPVKPNIGV